MKAALLSLLVALALVPGAAGAETLGQTWVPRTDREAEVLRLGLSLYGLRESVRGGATLRQAGRDNAAALRQSGDGNWGAVIQRGRGHRATLEQDGGGNVGAIVQVGRGGEADLAQEGGEVGVTVQLGW